jgi:outer membrane receptor protein involved in Fe transport
MTLSVTCNLRQAVTHLGLAIMLAALVASETAGQSITAENQPASNGNDEVVVLPEFRASGKKDDSYLSTESASGTRIAAKIIDLPFSVSVLTEDFINEFQLFDREEQAPFISGMAAGDPNSGSGGNRLRGFSTPSFRNGFRRTQSPESNSIARVEVVKGPQSAIYGRVSPGGVINYVSKVPSRKFQTGMTYSVGSYDFQRVDGYITGPLVKKKLYYRIDAAYHDFERPSDFWFNRTTNFSGSVTYMLSEKTSITLEHEYTDKVMGGSANFLRWRRLEGTTAITEGLAYYMPDREAGKRIASYGVNGAFQRVIRGNNSSYVQIEHRLSPEASVRLNAGYSDRGYSRHSTSTPGTWVIDSALTTAQRGILDTLKGVWVDTNRGLWAGARAGAAQTIDYIEKGFQVDLTRRWSTAIKQRSLLTFDLFEDTAGTKTWALSGTPLNNALAALGFTTTAARNSWFYPDPFNPAVSGYYPIPAFDPATWTRTAFSETKRLFYGSLLNHTMELMEGRLSLVGSARMDWGKYDDTSVHGRASQFTYSAGANYHIVPQKFVGYANVAAGFDPSPQTDPNTGAILGNKESFGGEVGLKGLLLGGAFSYSGAVFNVEEKNQVTNNPDNPDGLILELPRLVPGATTRAKGINLEVSGKLTDNLTLLANIAWTHVRIVKHAFTPSLVGTRPLGGQNVPPRTYAFAGRYSFRSGILSGVRLGLTYQYAQEHLRIAPIYNAAGVATTVPLNTEEKSEWSGVVSYNFRKFKWANANMSLNVLNLFNDQRMTGAAFVPAGREFRFTTGIRF